MLFAGSLNTTREFDLHKVNDKSMISQSSNKSAKKLGRKSKAHKQTAKEIGEEKKEIEDTGR